MKILNSYKGEIEKYISCTIMRHYARMDKPGEFYFSLSNFGQEYNYGSIMEVNYIFIIDSIQDNIHILHYFLGP